MNDDTGNCTISVYYIYTGNNITFNRWITMPGIMTRTRIKIIIVGMLAGIAIFSITSVNNIYDKDTVREQL